MDEEITQASHVFNIILSPLCRIVLVYEILWFPSELRLQRFSGITNPLNGEWNMKKISSKVLAEWEFPGLSKRHTVPKSVQGQARCCCCFNPPKTISFPFWSKKWINFLSNQLSKKLNFLPRMGKTHPVLQRYESLPINVALSWIPYSVSSNCREVQCEYF